MNENEQFLYEEEGMYNWEDWCRELDLLNCNGEHEWEYRYHTGETGRENLFSQCTRCGKKGEVGFLKHSTVPNFKEKIKLGEINKYDLKLLNEKSPTFEKYNAYRSQKLEQNKQVEKAYRKEFYSEYMKSDKWKAIRLKVLKRDDYLCQCCLEATATEVHHLSYAHWKDEWMHELMSVCYNCHHNKIHNK